MSEIVDLSEKKEELIPNLRRTDDDIRVAVELWRRDRAAAEAIYGHIKNWITTAVTNMHHLFEWDLHFQEDLSDWDVSNVTSMSYMFIQNQSFDCDLSNWETGKVRDMDFFLWMAHSFRCDISEWDVSSIEGHIRHAFHECPVNFRAIWEEHKDDPEWKEQCRQNRELRREQCRRDAI